MQLRPPRYLILTHVTTGPTGRPGAIDVPDTFLSALSVQVEALARVGFDVTLAAPVRPNEPTGASHTEMLAADLGLHFVALPVGTTMAQYMTRRTALRDVVARAAREAEVVQAGLGGHPVPMAQAVWDALGKTPAKRMLLFGGDPFPARQRHAASGRNPAKRYGKSVAVRRLAHFCRTAIREAAAVIAHAPAVAERFAGVWNERCHILPPGLIRDADLLSIADRPGTHAAGPLRVVCVGRQQAVAGVDHVIEAVARARRLSGDIELDLVGDLTHSPGLMDLIRARKLEPCVRLHGHLSDVRTREVLDRGHLFVWPALVPALDTSIYGAAARGLPIVTYSGGVADVAIAARGVGVVVPRGEATLLAEALLALSRDRGKVRALSIAARAWAGESTLEAVHRHRAAVARQLCQVN